MVPSAETAEQRRTRSAFDRIAPAFDGVVDRNPINAWMHDRNLSLLRDTFPPGSRLLELGCGTGTDAIALARRGCSVFGIDLSPAMVLRAREKAAAEGVEERTAFVHGPASRLEAMVAHGPWTPFDGAYANFSLTYEPSLDPIAEALRSVLRPGADFVCTLPNRVVLSEVTIYGPQLRFDKLLWRFRKPLLKDIHGTWVPIRAYSPWQVREAFADGFDLRALVGIPSFLPPVYLHPQYRRLGGGQRLLQALDRRFSSRFPWNRLGEHTLYRFRRRGS